VINLIRLQFIKQLHEIHRVCEIAVMQEQAHAVDVWIGVEMIDARGVEGARAPDDPVDFVSFYQEQIRQITSVLAGDPCDKCFFHCHSESRHCGIKESRSTTSRVPPSASPGPPAAPRSIPRCPSFPAPSFPQVAHGKKSLLRR